MQPRRWVLTLCLTAVLLTGCWDRKALEDLGFVTVIGLDKGPENSVVVTVQIENPRAAAASARNAGGGDNTPPVVVQRVQQATVSQALRDLEMFTSRRISLVQTKVIVIGRELAEQGLEAHIGLLTRHRELRRTVQVMVAEKTAEETLTTRPHLERDPSIFLEDLARRAHERTARAPRVTLHEFLTAYERQGRQASLPIVRQVEVKPGLEFRSLVKAELSGTAIFRTGVLVGELSPADTEILLMLTGNIGYLLEIIPVPGKPDFLAAFSLSPEKRQVRVVGSGSRPQLHMEIAVEAELKELQQSPVWTVTPEGLRDLEAQLSRQLTRKTNDMIRKLQQEFRADIVGFGDYFRVKFIDWPSWQQYDWPERFPDADITIVVSAKIRRVGMTFQPVVPE